ncbi:LPS assembly protein LptD, partial [Xanthomonas perforans]|uniref:LPS assembly protein LptD n=1 Tax=Xanthomonas perforans TaxID=442694 RepID=UPI000F8D60BB
VEDFTSRLNGMGSASSLQSTVGIYGTGETWTAGLMADRWQLTDYTLDEQALPYNRQPRVYFTWEKPFGIFEAGVYAEAVRFTHDDSYFVQPPSPSAPGETNNRDDSDEYVRTNIRNKEYGAGACG